MGWRYFDNGTIRSTTGLMDVSFGIRYQLLNERSAESPWIPTLTFRAGAVLPGSYNENLHSPRGCVPRPLNRSCSRANISGWPGLGAYFDGLYRWNRTTGNDQYIPMIGFFQQIKQWEINMATAICRRFPAATSFGWVMAASSTHVTYRENNDAIEAGFSYTTPKLHIRYGFHTRAVIDGNNSDDKFWVGGSINIPLRRERGELTSPASLRDWRQYRSPQPPAHRAKRNAPRGPRPSAPLQAATTFTARLCAARLRWFSSRIFLRRRRFFGVASTYSSGPDVFERAFEGQLERRIELNAFAVTLRTHVGQLFRFARIDRDIVLASVFADDHAFINRVAGLDHQPAAFLDHVQRVSHGFAAFHADQRTVLARGDFAAVRTVFMEQMAHHAEAAGLVDEIGFETDQAARRNQRLDADIVAVVIHVRDFSLCGRRDFP